MIKMVLTACISLLFFTEARSQSRINVQVVNFANNNGNCIVCIYNSKEEFTDKGTPVKCTTVTVANKTTNTVFENIPSGSYAVLVIHDANSNRKFDTNFLGIPKEGYGASGNKLPFAAAPKFDDNKFSVADGGTANCHIKLRYVY
jgi:uncharacterized protein (DUF2141 family)